MVSPGDSHRLHKPEHGEQESPPCQQQLPDASGICGEDVTWSYDKTTRTLTVAGTGSMDDYPSKDVVPWNDYKKEVKTLVIGDGITGIGSNAFNDAISLSSVSLPEALGYIGELAFKSCGSLTAEIARACPSVTDVELFDIYRGEQIGEGRKSMAFKITFTPADKALAPEDIDRFIKKILGNLKFKLGAEIR